MWWIFLPWVFGSELKYRFAESPGGTVQLDRPSTIFDYRVLEQITEPWILNPQVRESCVFRDLVIKPRSIEFAFRDGLRWSDGSPIDTAFLAKSFQSLVSSTRYASQVTFNKQGSRWQVSWSPDAHALLYSLQRSEFGVIHDSNRSQRAWTDLGPTFGPFRVHRAGETFSLTPNPHYPKDCGAPAFSVLFINSQDTAVSDQFLDKSIDIAQVDSDQFSATAEAPILATGASEIHLGSSALWTTLVFGSSVPRAVRKHWKAAILDPNAPTGALSPLLIQASLLQKHSQTLAGLARKHSRASISFVSPSEFKERRLEGKQSTFAVLGLRYPDPEDKWEFLRTFYPHLRNTLITDARLANARRIRETGSLSGYEELDRANEQDPWIIYISNVKRRIFLRKGLTFRSRSDVILRLDGITE